jgi:hypothetical protein
VTCLEETQNQPVILDKTRHEFFNDYPCEWHGDTGFTQASLWYKTGTILGWIMEGDVDGTHEADFHPDGWSDPKPEPAEAVFFSLDEAKRWLEDQFLAFFYPQGCTFGKD